MGDPDLVRALGGVLSRGPARGVPHEAPPQAFAWFDEYASAAARRAAGPTLEGAVQSAGPAARAPRAARRSRRSGSGGGPRHAAPAGGRSAHRAVPATGARSGTRSGTRSAAGSARRGAHAAERSGTRRPAHALSGPRRGAHRRPPSHSGGKLVTAGLLSVAFGAVALSQLSWDGTDRLSVSPPVGTLAGTPTPSRVAVGVGGAATGSAPAPRPSSRAAVLVEATPGRATATRPTANRAAPSPGPRRPPGTTPAGTPSRSTPPVAPQPAPPPAALRVEVTAPDEVVAGQEAELQVTWSDGSGHFGGAGADWDDGSVLGPAVTVRRCDGVAPAGRGTFPTAHTWEEPGTYDVRVTVVTYTCDGRLEEAEGTVQVVVTAAEPTTGPTTDPPSGPTTEPPSEPA